MNISLKLKLGNLGIDINGLTQSIQKDLYLSVSQLAKATYNKAVELAGERLHGLKQDYVSSLHMEEESPGVFVIYLEDKADWIESGSAVPYPNLPNLLAGPKAKVSRDGRRYNVIPIKKTTVERGSVKFDLASDMQKIVAERQFEKIKEGISPKSGKWVTAERLVDNKGIPKNLQGLTRVREYENKEAKRPISSSYLIFRVASDKQDPNTKWVIPPRPPLGVFKDTFQWAETQLDVILAEFFGK